MSKQRLGKFRRFRILFIILVSLVTIGIAGYFIGQTIVRHKVETALQNLPPGFAVAYSSLESNVFAGSLTIHDLRVRLAPGPDSTHRHEATIRQLAVRGIGYFALLTGHRLHIRLVRLEGCDATLDDYLLDKKIPLPKMQGQPPFKEVSLDELEVTDLQAKVYKEEGNRKEGEGDKGKDGQRGEDSHRPARETMGYEGSLDIRSIHLDDVNKPVDTANLHYGAVKVMAKNVVYLVPDTYERLRLKNMELNSADSTLHIESVRIDPTVSQEEVGRIKHTQTDVVEGLSEGIEVSGLRFRDLMGHKLVADKIVIHRNNLHVFRDRRLPRDESGKPLPVDFLKNQPVTIRVRSVKFGATTFAYEEFPAKGDQTGTLRIVGLKGSLTPLINHPVEGDPAYMTLVSEGSLMGSGTVTATTKMPLRKGGAYGVEGVFRELDVTKLNPSAENLGGIHLKSGILNSLAFQFDMTAEKSTGKIVGEYHNLVVQKLKGLKEPKKVDKMKSFALKAFIIPLNKDRSLPESKRTGKVDYKRDPSRMFSYYLLHSLLVGVKSSFSLGFLLPG
jgi:hypothetical protein